MMDDTTKKHVLKICTSPGDVIIVDVMNALYRYLYVHSDLSVTVDGMIIPTGHIYGITSYVLTLKKRFPGCSIILAMDGIDTTRRNMNPAYKDNRSDKEVSVRACYRDIITLCGAAGDVYYCFNRKYEADDIMYTVSNSLRNLMDKNGISKTIRLMTNDKDMFQCVREGVEVVRKLGGKNQEGEVIRSVEDVQRVFEGVHPSKLAIYRAIIGDSSDNLKGYYRFFKKVAAEIANGCDMEGDQLVQREALSQKALDGLSKIRENYELFRTNYLIMKLKTFDYNLDSADPVGNIDEVEHLLHKYRLSSYRNQLHKVSPYAAELQEAFERLS